MYKEGEKVKLNGEDYIISPCAYTSGYKACSFCASVNIKPPCIKSFDYSWFGASNDTFTYFCVTFI
jgi:hypothetical protein